MRADVYLFEKGHADSRTRAASLIGAGSVRIDGETVKKPSFELDPDAEHTVEISDACPYVSRGGLKLEHALTQFCIDVKDLAALDVGASTGGFTDCLLKHGAKAVCAVDNGSGQLHPSLAADPRVRSVENCNARYLTGDTLGFSPDLIVMDVSFISQTLILPALYPVLKPGGTLVTLIKPQFECGRKALSKKGLVRDPKDREEAVRNVTECAKALGFSVKGTAVSPIEGGDGNIEYLLYAVKPAETDL